MPQPPRSNRRQFLKAASLRDEVMHRLDTVSTGVEAGLPPAAGPSDVEPVPEAATGGSYLLEISRQAMACEFAVHLNAGQTARETELAIHVLDQLEPLEQQMSVYRASSEISALNQLAASRSVPVEANLFGLLRRAQNLAAETDGAFDITTGPLLRAWGIDRRAGRVPSDETLSAARSCVGWQHLVLDEERLSIRFHRAGVEINLGAIGKGFAIDRCAQLLTEAGIDDFLIHGGHSSLLVRGRRWRESVGSGWPIGIRHPLRPDRPIAQLMLHNRAMSTSGCGTQHFYHQGQRFGHILDPRTGWPADGVLSVTAVTPDATTADALSTAFYVLGEAGTAAYCERHPETSVFMTLPGPRAGEVRVATWGLEPDILEPQL